MGYHSICVARNEIKLKAVVADIEKNSGKADYICADLMTDEAIEELSQTLLQKYGTPSVCVFSAGYSSDKSFTRSTSNYVVKKFK